MTSMSGAKSESAQKILVQILEQLDKLAPRSSLIARVIKEFPGIERDVSEEELRKIERRVLIGEPQGSAPTDVFEDLMKGLRTIADDHKTFDELSGYLKFETRPTPVANAQIVKLEELSWRVEVNSGMWSLLSAFARILALSTSPQEAETDPLMLLPEARQQMLANLVQLEIDAPELLAEVASRPLPDNDQEMFAVISSENAKRFVVAHELLHFFLGHLFSGAVVDRQLRVVVGQPANVGPKVQGSTRWDDEMSADKGGFDLLLKLAVKEAEREHAGRPDVEDRRRGAGIRAYLGVITALGTLLILEAGSEKIRSSTHPPADIRFRSVRTHIEQNYPGAAEALFRMSNAMETFYRSMAQEIATHRTKG